MIIPAQRSCFFFIKEKDIVNQVVDLVTNRLKNYGDYDVFRDIQVLTPTKKGDAGTRNLNKELWNTVSFIHDEEVITSDFFEIYNSYFEDYDMQ